MKLNRLFRIDIEKNNNSWGPNVYSTMVYKDAIYKQQRGQISNFQLNDRVVSYQNMKIILERNINKGEIVAYHKTPMGLMFIFKSPRKFFSFYWNQFGIWSSGNYRNCMRMDDKHAWRYLEKYGKIVDKELWRRFRTKMIVREL